MSVQEVESLAGGERGTGTPFVDFKCDDWDFTLNLDLTSVYSVAQAFVNLMQKAMADGKQGELNSAAVFLGAEESSYVTGQILAVDGGYTYI